MDSNDFVSISDSSPAALPGCTIIYAPVARRVNMPRSPPTHTAAVAMAALTAMCPG